MFVPLIPSPGGFPPRSPLRALLVTAAAFASILLWDLAGLDLPMARLAGGAGGFALREHRLFILALHEVPRFLSAAGALALVLAVRWPVGFLRRVGLRERIQLAVTVLAALAAVSLIKNTSHTSCPWDLAEFGGTARHVSHWAWTVDDGGPGRCFPAGHASAAFAYVGGWFALRRAAPAAAAVWLAVALAAGLALGLAQQWRGAHYMSHTLWTAWVCWTIALAIDAVVMRLHHRRARRDARGAKLNEP